MHILARAHANTPGRRNWPNRIPPGCRDNGIVPHPRRPRMGGAAVGLRRCHEGRMIVTVDPILESLRELATASGRFANVELEHDVLRCRARNIESEAWYLVKTSDDGIAVLLVTPDRWLSESIEADLMHSGDNLEELREQRINLIFRFFGQRQPIHL